TTTSTRARSACCAWRPRRVWACATRRCAPVTSTRSTPSAASEASRGGSAPSHPTHWPHIDFLREDPHTMSAQGLSIFDEPDGEGADEQPTKVMKAQGQDESATVSKPTKEPGVDSGGDATSTEADGAEPAAVEKPQAPAAAAAATGGRPLPPARASHPTSGLPAAQSAPPSFATVRRGGYDKAAV